MAHDEDTAPLSLQLDDHRAHALDHVQIGLARSAGVAVGQLVGGALGELLGVPLLVFLFFNSILIIKR